MREGDEFGPYGPYGPYGAPPGPPRRRSGLLTHLGVAVLAAVVGAGVTFAAYHPSSSVGSTGPAAPSSVPGGSAVPSPAASPSSGGPTGNASQQAIMNKVEPGLVIVRSTLQYNSLTGAGTGMVINPDGLVLTNNHVIEDSTKLTATVVSTGKTYPVKVIGYDKTGDISLIQLQGASGLRTVPLGNSATIKTGDQVLAMGNAEGQGTIVPAPGQITALNQTITASDQGGSVSTETLHGMIQTNANIVAGDSGGPLASSAGQVVGMDTAGSSVSFGQQAPNTGFAIPINTALSVARQIAAGHGSSTITMGYPPFVGIFIGSGSSSNPQAQEQQSSGSGNGFGGSGSGTPSCYTSNANLTVPSSIAPVSSGTLVVGTICGSPAASAGMTGGAVITAVNGHAIGSPASLTSTLAGFRPGDTISVTWVSPAGKRTTSSLRLLPGPPQ